MSRTERERPISPRSSRRGGVPGLHALAPLSVLQSSLESRCGDEPRVMSSRKKVSLWSRVRAIDALRHSPSMSSVWADYDGAAGSLSEHAIGNWTRRQDDRWRTPDAWIAGR